MQDFHRSKQNCHTNHGVIISGVHRVLTWGINLEGVKKRVRQAFHISMIIWALLFKTPWLKELFYIKNHIAPSRFQLFSLFSLFIFAFVYYCRRSNLPSTPLTPFPPAPAQTTQLSRRGPSRLRWPWRSTRNCTRCS